MTKLRRDSMCSLIMREETKTKVKVKRGNNVSRGRHVSMTEEGDKPRRYSYERTTKDDTR